VFGCEDENKVLMRLEAEKLYSVLVIRVKEKIVLIRFGPSC
jgi:hypothetical protein